MAEQNNNSRTQINTFSKGLHTDYHPSRQPEGTYRFALNSVAESVDGDMGNIINELGNTECLSIPDGFLINGAISVSQDQIVLFLTNNFESIIALKDKDCSYKELTRNTCLNFSTHNQITGFYRKRSCGRSVYFTDGSEPIRTFVLEDLINDPDRYKTNGNWDCEKFGLFRNFEHSCINIENIESGGSIPIGTIQFAIQYLDEDENPTNFFGITCPIPIIDENYGISYNNLDGGSSSQTPPADKSIELLISDLDNRFDQVRLAVIQTTDGTGNPSSAYIVDDIPIIGNSINYTYRGIDESVAQTIPVEDITIDNINYNTAQHLNQIHNRMVISNLSQEYIDYSEFQKEALNIQVEYFTRTFPAEDNRSFANTPVAVGGYETKGYMRDEIYALGIVWILNDGSETPPFHIPGRKANETHDGSSITNNLISSQTINTNHNRVAYSSASKWDTEFKQLDFAEYEHLNISLSNLDRWQVHNTAIRKEKKDGLNQLSQPEQYSTGYHTKGELSYWESQERYPLVKDCNGNYIFPTETVNGETVGKPIRHHKMPDTTLEPHFYGYNDPDNPLTSSGFSSGINTINPLGLILSNIQPPAKYQNKVQGYKIVRSNRTDGNSSVIDKGMMMPNLFEFFEKNGHHDSIYRQSIPFYYDVEATTSQTTDKRPAGLSDDILDSKFCGSNTREDQWYTNKTNSKTFSGGADTTVNSEALFSLHTPKTKFERKNLNETNLKLEREIYGSSYKISSGNFFDGNNVVKIIGDYRYSEIPQDNNTNRQVNKSAYLDPNSNLIGIFNHNFANSTQQETYVVGLSEGYDNPNPNNATSVLPVTSGGVTPATYNNFDPKNMESQAPLMQGYYTSIKKYDPNQYNSLEDVEYVVATTCPFDKNDNKVNEVWGGDTFISKLYMKKTLQFEDCDGGDNPDEDVRSVFSAWCESTINSELRHEGNINDVNQKYYPKSLTAEDELNGDPTADNGWEKFNFYAYNKDYSNQNDQKIYFPLEDTFNYCEDCNKKFPVRQAYSEQSFSTEQQDKYRIFKVDSFRDLPAETGEITDAFIKDYNLYTRTENSLWHNPTNPQRMKTSESNVFIGTGDFFNIRPKELVSSETGYAGGYGKEARVITQFGAFFVNTEQGRVFLLSDQLNEINKKGIEKYLRKELPLKLNQQFVDIFGINYPYFQNPASTIGTGVLAEYDKAFNRYILTKRDFKLQTNKLHDSSIITDISSEINSIKDDNIFVVKDGNGYDFYIKKGPQDIERVGYPENYPDYFENHSFTISYSIDSQAWRSWHSYLPRFYTRSETQFLSTRNSKNDSKLWKHNTGQYQHFYNNFEDFIVEFTSGNPFQVNTFNAIHYIANAYRYDDNFLDNYIRLNELTFDKVWVYNDVQSSDILELVPRQNSPFASVNPLNNDQILVDKNEELWSINNLRDVVIDYNNFIITKSWLFTNYQNNYFIDKMPNQNNHNLSKTQFEKERFRDRYVNVRFFFRPTEKTGSFGESLENAKFVVEGFVTSTDPSFK